MTTLELLFVLLALHCVADYPLQGDFLAMAKSRHTAAGKAIWWMALPSHGLIHGGAVFLATGSLAFGLAETVAHSIIDLLKCESRINYWQDQALHVLCKIAWAVLLGLEVVP